MTDSEATMSAHSAARAKPWRIICTTMTFLVLILAGSLLAVVSSYLMQKFGF